jgi:hypothetical protein
MSNADNTETTADAMHSSDYETMRSSDHAMQSWDDTQVSGWSCSSLGDPAAVDASAVHDHYRQAGPSKSLSNGVLAAVLVGTLSAFGALGLVLSEYYANPNSAGPVAVVPGAVAAPATPSAPAGAPQVANVAVPTVVNAPADSGTTSSGQSANSNPGRAVPRKGPAPRVVAPPAADAGTPPDSGPAPTDPAAPPAAVPGPVVVVNVPLPKLAPPQVPSMPPLAPPSVPMPTPQLPPPPVADPSPAPVQEPAPEPVADPSPAPVQQPAPEPGPDSSPLAPDLMPSGTFS